MQRIVFIHGMFQNPRSWERWIGHFSRLGYDCAAPAWPLHEGEPALLRANPPEGLGALRLQQVIAAMEAAVGDDKPIVIGHSVGGLIAQILLNRGKLSAAVAIASVAPNGMLDFDWGFFKNSLVIANPLKGDEPAFMDAQSFHGSFANSLSEPEARRAFDRTATHDSRNVFRDCMGEDGRIDLSVPHAPLLLIGAEKDEIIPHDLVEKNATAYADPVEVRTFAGRSHFICGEPGWEEVAGFAADWLDRQAGARPAP